MRLCCILNMRLGDDLISVKAHVLAVGVVLTSGPLTCLDILHPALEGNTALRRLVDLPFLQHVAVVALIILFELTAHKASTIPVFLTAASQGLSAVNTHDVASNFLCAIKTKIEQNQLCDAC